MNPFMATAKSIDKEIAHHLNFLSMEQKKAVLGIVKIFAKEEDSWWNNKSYLKEMDRRAEELESGKVKGISLEELEKRVKESYKNPRRKRK